MSNPIKIVDDNFRIDTSVIIYLLESFQEDNFLLELLALNVRYFDKQANEFLTTNDLTKLEYFKFYFAYSFDGQNFSNYQTKEDFTITSNIYSEIFINIKIEKIVPIAEEQTKTLFIEKNIDSKYYYFDLMSIAYDEEIFDLKNPKVIKFETLYNLILQKPRWNFYDNQSVMVRRWLDQCNAISEMYGHSCIYFKTEPSETINTLANHPKRNVVNIKKIMIMAPNNELPQDRNIYTDWDMPLQDDFVIHIIKEKFEIAFGQNNLPSEKDYLYLPIINKLFRVTAIQPKNGFMGKIGWWETFLAKYEDDESVSIDQKLKDSMTGIEGFDEAFDIIGEIEDEDFDDSDIDPTQIFNELNEFKKITVNSEDKIGLVTTQEKKEVNQNYTNKLVDSNFYISLKETEKNREFYNNRLQLVSINPDENAYPITMYNNSEVEKRTVALQYTLKDYVTKNKFGLELSIDETLIFSFNFVLLKKFSGEIIDIIGANGNLSFFTFLMERNSKINFISHNTQQTQIVNYEFELNELYNIEFKYNYKQITIIIYKLVNKEKKLIYTEIYNEPVSLPITPIELSNIQLYGGKFLSGEIILNLNEKNILTDNVNPILKMKQF
jgi:hypothetical protein